MEEKRCFDDELQEESQALEVMVKSMLLAEARGTGDAHQRISATGEWLIHYTVSSLPSSLRIKVTGPWDEVDGEPRDVSLMTQLEAVFHIKDDNRVFCAGEIDVPNLGANFGITEYYLDEDLLAQQAGCECIGCRTEHVLSAVDNALSRLIDIGGIGEHNV